MKLGIMQPYFFPYIGYFQLMNAVDEYVIYDDVNYIKSCLINSTNKNETIKNFIAHRTWFCVAQTTFSFTDFHNKNRTALHFVPINVEKGCLFCMKRINVVFVFIWNITAGTKTVMSRRYDTFTVKNNCSNSKMISRFVAFFQASINYTSSNSHISLYQSNKQEIMQLLQKLYIRK